MNRPRGALPQRLAISDRKRLNNRGWASWIGELLAAGVDTVQIREKQLSDRELLHLARETRSATAGRMQLYINARPDIAIAVGADGVHLPHRGLPVDRVAERFGGRLTIGYSAHSIQDAHHAVQAGADYVTLSPIFASPGKGSPIGLQPLREVARSGIPVLGLGGIGVEQIPAVLETGAQGVAGIRVFLEPATLPTAPVPDERPRC